MDNVSKIVDQLDKENFIKSTEYLEKTVKEKMDDRLQVAIKDFKDTLDVK